MNHLKALARLKNRYYGLRHGESKANHLGLIVSSPEIGTCKFGLTEPGRFQVLDTLSQAKLASVSIYCSDFLRARETAELARRSLAAAEPIHAEELRERYFGILDGSTGENYARVWEHDRVAPQESYQGAEPAAKVLERTTRLVKRLESLHQDRVILLVSHGDPLQILECGFRGLCPSRHRELPSLGTAELRELTPAQLT